MLFINSFPSGPFETNAYLVGCENSKHAAIVDPAPESFPLLVEAIEKGSWQVKMIVLTHSHYDHIGDLAKTKKYFSCPIYAHPLDKENILSPGSDGIPFFLEIEGTEPDHELEDGMILSLGSLVFSVWHTPGHSPGSICLYEKKAKTLISGDTLFKGAMGNIALPTASPKDMKASLKRLSSLPKDVKVYPGHGQSTTIEQESWIHAPEKVFPDLDLT